MDWTGGAKKRIRVNRLGDPRKRRSLYVSLDPRTGFDESVVTNNEREFRRVPGLSVENCLKP